MNFKFELNLKENQGVYIDCEPVFFKTPTFEKISDFLKKEYNYKSIHQIMDIVLKENEIYNTFYIGYSFIDEDEKEISGSTRLTISKLIILD